MTSICMYFQVHQPMRLRRIQSFAPPREFELWDDDKNREILDRAAEKCYLPANRLIRDLILETDGWFRVAYSITGTFLEQAERLRPDIIESFQALADTGHVEFLSETYYHSLTGLWDDPSEFERQVDVHRSAMRRFFGEEPTVFRNTELIYDNRIARRVERMGFDAILTEGTERILGSRSPNHLYRPSHPESRLKVLLKNYRLSDDIAFRFSTPDWPERPLTADKYANWLAASPGDTINLFMDYETFGEHQWPETGIFEFLRHLPRQVRNHPHLGFALPREVAAENEPRGEVDAPFAISWADSERDVSAWLHNRMQHYCFEELKALGPMVLSTEDPRLIHTWRLLQTSDHLYYCTTKHMGDQDIHAYFSPYDSPYIAFINYMNAISYLRARAAALLRERGGRQPEVVWDRRGDETTPDITAPPRALDAAAPRDEVPDRHAAPGTHRSAR